MFLYSPKQIRSEGRIVTKKTTDFHQSFVEIFVRSEAIRSEGRSPNSQGCQYSAGQSPSNKYILSLQPPFPR